MLLGQRRKLLSLLHYQKKKVRSEAKKRIKILFLTEDVNIGLICLAYYTHFLAFIDIHCTDLVEKSPHFLYNER